MRIYKFRIKWRTNEKIITHLQVQIVSYIIYSTLLSFLIRKFIDINKLQLSSDEIHKGRSGIRYTMDIKVKNTTKGTLIGVSTQGQGSIEEKNHSLSIILSLYSKVPKIMYYFSIVALVSMIAYYFIFTEETKILHIVLFAFLILFNQNYGSYIEQEELMVII